MCFTFKFTFTINGEISQIKAYKVLRISSVDKRNNNNKKTDVDNEKNEEFIKKEPSFVEMRHHA